MIKSKLVFLPQNDNQRINFCELANDLVTNNYIRKDNILFVTIENAFYDQKPHPIQGFREIKFEWHSSKSIYRMGLIERLKNIKKNINNLKNLEVINNNIFIIGNDGAIQRYLAHYFEPRKLYIICDTIVSAQKKRYILYKFFFKIILFLKISHYFPGISFHTKNDGIFMCNKNNKDLLLERGVSSPIHISKMPIHVLNKRKFIQKRENNDNDSINILYVTSAYIWHRKFKEDAYQKKDLLDLVNYFYDKPRYKIKIRIHPREDINDYLWLKTKYPKITFSFNSELIDDFLWCTKLVTAQSSVAFESYQLGIETFIYRRNFGDLQTSSVYNEFIVIKCLSKIMQNDKIDTLKDNRKNFVNIAELLFKENKFID